MFYADVPQIPINVITTDPTTEIHAAESVGAM
jgi:hypothetical protein